jgi:hypothetical protein
LKREPGGNGMAVDSAQVSSRTMTVLAVAAAHGFVVWLIWRVAVPLPIEPEAFTSFLFWVPATKPARPPSAARPRAAATAAPQPPALNPAPAPTPASASGTGITLPANPGAQIDWRAALTGAAAAELDKEQRTREQVRALTHRYAAQDDPRNSHPGPTSGFRWYDAGIHRFDTRSWIPVLHLNDRCVVVMFIIATCAIGHIEVHGDLFEGAAALHDETLATPRPNDVP